MEIPKTPRTVVTPLARIEGVDGVDGVDNDDNVAGRDKRAVVEAPLPTATGALPAVARKDAALGKFAHVDFVPAILAPKADTDYAVTSTVNGAPVKLTVRFTAEFVESLRAASAKIDTQRGALVLADRTVPLFDGEPPWSVPLPGGVRAVPKGELVVDGTIQAPFPKMRAIHGDAFFEIEPFEGPKLPATAYDPLTTMPPVRRTVQPGVELIAPTEALFEKARTAFSEVCSKTSRAWQQQGAALQPQREKLEAMLSSLKAWETPAGANLSELLPRALALVGGDVPSWGYRTALGTLQERIDQIAMKQAPVQLVVVPEGKHWQSMARLFPDMEMPAYFRGGALDAMSRAAVNRTKSSTVVFLPAEDLNGVQRDSRHELYHLVDLVYADANLSKRIDDIHAATTEAGGSFARTYGTTRTEFLTTMGELFEGCLGQEGTTWLRDHQPMLYDVFVDATGRDPLA